MSSITSRIVRIVAPPSLTLVSASDAWIRRADINSAARRRLGRAVGADAARLAAGERQERDAMALGGVAQQDPADADLDVVGVRADGQHDLLARRAALAREGDQRRAPSRARRPGRMAWSGSRRRPRACAATA